MRNLGGAIGIAGCGTILNDRTNLHFLRLAEHLNNTNTAMMEMLRPRRRTRRRQSGGDAVMGHAIALRQLWTLAMREAQTQTFADAFLALMVCLGLATMMVPLMRKVGPPKRCHRGRPLDKWSSPNGVIPTLKRPARQGFQIAARCNQMATAPSGTRTAKS